jgi:hypothetical protein
MNSNILVVGGILITLIAVGSVILDSDEIDESYSGISAEKKEEMLTPARLKETSITYEHSEEKKPMPVKRKVAAVVKKVDEKPLPLGLSTYDAKRQFEIAMFDPDQMYKPSDAPRAKKYVTVEGRVDGSKFAIEVPDYFIENPDNVKLRLTNSKTGKSKTIPASFLYNLTTSGEPAHHIVSMSSQNPADYEYSTHPQIAPPAFGQ